MTVCCNFECDNEIIRKNKLRCSDCRHKEDYTCCVCGKDLMNGPRRLFCSDCMRMVNNNRIRKKPSKEKISEYNKRFYQKHGVRRRNRSDKIKVSEYNRMYYLKVTKKKRLKKRESVLRPFSNFDLK
jgi:hypothetical protein